MSEATIDYSKFEGHTPGPWPIAYVSGAIRHLVRNCEADCFLSGEEWSSMNVAGFYGWDKFKDSPLIAAAPTLLARCKAMEAERRELRGSCSELMCVLDDVRRFGFNGPLMNQAVAVLDRARAALAANQQEQA